MKIKKQVINNKFARALFLTVLALFLYALPSCRALTSQARGQMSNLRCEPTTRIVNGQFDYGVNIIVDVKNIGKSGVINVTANLSTSEGEWRREQDVEFDSSESQTLTYFFDEPTVNVNNQQCKIMVFPQA